jgi:hypothetical protein
MGVIFVPGGGRLDTPKENEIALEAFLIMAVLIGVADWRHSVGLGCSQGGSWRYRGAFKRCQRQVLNIWQIHAPLR